MPITAVPYSAAYGPLALPGVTCQLWVDGADTSTMSLASSSINQITDKASGAILVGSSTKPTLSTYNNNYVMTFGGSSYFQNTTFSIGQMNISIFVVCGETTHTENTGFVVLGNSGTDYSQVNNMAITSGYTPSGTTIQVDKAFTNGGFDNVYLGPTITPFSVFGNVFASPSNMIYRNGNSNSAYLTNSTTFTTSTGVILGARLSSGVVGTPLIGTIAEVIMYNIALSDTQRRQVEGYLAQKWGLTANLPAGHPGLTQTLYNARAYQTIIPFTPSLTTLYNSPAAIAGCQLWLDGSDSTTITGTSSVTAWRDKSPNAYTMVNNQATCSVSASALNGLSAMYVPSGANLKIASFVGRTKFTCFIVGKSAAGKLLIGSGPFYIYQQSDDLMYVGNAANGTYFSSDDSILVPVVAANTWSIFCVGYDNATSYLTNPYRVNGSNRPATVATRYGGSIVMPDLVQTYALYLNSLNGTNSYDSSYYAEVLYYNRTLSTAECQSVEGYLAQKWGMTSYLQAGHPGLTASYFNPSWLTTVTSGTTPYSYANTVYYNVTPAAWSYNWQKYLQSLVAANATGVTTTTTNVTGGGTYTANGWFGCVLGSDGNIYFSPATATNILKLTVSTGVTTNITGGASYTGGFSGGVLGPDGNIYFGPGSGANILKLNVSTGVTTNITGGASYTGSWEGGALGADGNIYFSPVSATNILKLTVSTGVTSNITGAATYTTGWRGAVAAPNGNIYFTPCGATNILVLNVATGETSNITGGASYAGSWRGGGVIGPDGNIYFPPYGAGNVLKLNLATGVTTNIGTTAGNSIGGILAPNGNIYFGPFSTSGTMYILNVASGVITSITMSATYTDLGWCGGVLASDGNIYFSPYAANNVLKLTLSGLKQLPSINYCLSAYANKF